MIGSGAKPPNGIVRGLNVLHKLRRKQFSYAWNEEKTSKIAKSFETLPDPSDRKQKRFPLPVEIDPGSLEKEEKITYLAQNNQYDIDFLLALARRAGYVIFVKEKQLKDNRVIKPRRLYFGPSDAKQPDSPRRLQADPDHRQSDQQRHGARLESLDQATDHRPGIAR